MPSPPPKTGKRRVALVAWIALLGALGTPAPARAQEAPAPAAPEGAAPAAEATPEAAPEAAPAPAPAPVVDEKLEQAKQLFKTGNEFLDQGDYYRALEHFLKSRALVASWQNTINAGICLDELKRYDEALELFEAALIEFPKEIPSHQRNRIGPRLEVLRETLGSLEVSANVDGTVVIDGRQRGKLPLTAPLRVLPGERGIRIIKDGYETFEQRIVVTAKQTLTIDARLKALAAAGTFVVHAPGAEGAELLVDGAVVGQLPWKGTLAPGPHLYQVQKGDLGSDPKAITVVQKQTVSAEPVLRPLSQPVRLQVAPPTADLFIDGTRVDGGWQGRLTVGRHELSAREEGYFPGSKRVDLTSRTSGELTLELRADPKHPRWVKPVSSKIWVEAFGGYALGTSLGSDAESCSTTPCTTAGTAAGYLVGLRGAYEFPIPLSLEAGAGFLAMSNRVDRSTTMPLETTTARFELNDTIELRGGLASLGVGYRLALGRRFGIQARVHVAAFFATASDDIEVEITTPDRGSRAGRVENSGAETSAVSVLIAPELQAHFQLGPLRLGAGITTLILPVAGPSNDHGEAFAVESCPVPRPDPLPPQCVKGSNAVAGETAFGPFALFAPIVSLGYQF